MDGCLLIGSTTHELFRCKRVSSRYCCRCSYFPYVHQITVYIYNTRGKWGDEVVLYIRQQFKISSSSWCKSFRRAICDLFASTTPQFLDFMYLRGSWVLWYRFLVRRGREESSRIMWASDSFYLCLILLYLHKPWNKEKEPTSLPLSTWEQKCV